MTHANDPSIDAILKSLAAALREIDEEDAHVFAELTELGLGNSQALDTWRQLMTLDLSFFRSETSQRLRDEGRTEEVAGSILRVLERRGFAIGDDVRDRVTSCTDLDVLRGWLDQSVTVATVAELFEV